MNRAALTTAVLVSLFLASCHKDPAPTATPDPPAAAKPGESEGDSPLLHPEKATLTAPDKYKVKFTTTKGDFVVEVTRAWAPNGADRFFNLVKLGYYDNTKFFRAVDGFMVQWGINGSGRVNVPWQRATIQDDTVEKSNKRGFITFATAGKNHRTTQIFINYADNARLDKMGFSPFGEVVDGMTVVDSLYKGYGEGAPGGRGPNQGRIQSEGNTYLEQEFPMLDGVKSAVVM
jgi:peptidyl-prolyl cis-trans isomerase A (cyclophilin A)